MKAPSAPVLNQENYGTLVHVNAKADWIFRNGKKEKPDAKLASWDLLKPGDRMIFQKEATTKPNTRSTALYLGPLTLKGKTYKHAVIQAVNKTLGVILYEAIPGKGQMRSYRFSLRD